MHLVKPSTRLADESCRNTSAMRNSIPETALLRKVGHYPEVYGYIVYIDPYLDFVAIDVLTTDGSVTAWAGTHRQCYTTWESFLLKGAT